MKVRTFVIAAAFVLAAAPAFAQGRPGGGQGQGQGQRPKQGQGQAQQKGPGGSEQGRGTMDRDRDRTRQRIHATDQQRDQFRACTQSQNRVRTQARDMANLAKRRGFTSDEARQQRDQLRQLVRVMQEEHHRLMQGLNSEQQEAARMQIREMERVQERLQTRMAELDRTVDANPFSFGEVSNQAREVERAMQEWQKQHRKLGNEIGTQP